MRAACHSATLTAKPAARGKSSKGRPYSPEGVLQLSLFDVQIVLDDAGASVAQTRAALIAAYQQANAEVRDQIVAAYRENVMVAQSIRAARARLRDLNASVAA